MLRTVFKIALRQTEGLVDSVLKLMNLPISGPDHTTVSRRAVGADAAEIGVRTQGAAAHID